MSVDREKPYLTVVTRCYRRPKALAKCLETVQGFGRDVQHVLLFDDTGYGLEESNKRFHKDRYLVDGTWVLICDDDDYILDTSLTSRLRNHEKCDVVIFKMWYGKQDLPPVVSREPQYGKIGSCCFVVKNQVWKDNIVDFGVPRGGDYNFISKLYKSKKYKFGCIDHVFTAIQRVSSGKPEQ